MLKRVQAICQSPEECFRVWILFDSDRLQPSEPNPGSERIRAACGDVVYFHQLHRRSIENYLPIPVLSLWVKGSANTHKVSAFKSLTRTQRNHFNMKSGFSGETRRNDGLTAGTLYEGIDRHVREVLEEGFGERIAELFGNEVNCVGAWYASDEQLAETQPMIKRLLAML